LAEAFVYLKDCKNQLEELPEYNDIAKKEKFTALIFLVNAVADLANANKTFTSLARVTKLSEEESVRQRREKQENYIKMMHGEK